MTTAIPTPPAPEPGCIFCKIVAGEIPAYKLYEDEHALAFLDVGPLSRGHSLVIPKAHYTTLDQMPDGLVGACASLLPRLGKAVVAATGAPGWNVLQNNGPIAGQVVMHMHFHIIPRNEGDSLGYRWSAGKLDSQDAQTLLNDITSRLN